jgi:hypothetical protein
VPVIAFLDIFSKQLLRLQKIENRVFSSRNPLRFEPLSSKGPSLTVMALPPDDERASFTPNRERGHPGYVRAGNERSQEGLSR